MALKIIKCEQSSIDCFLKKVKDEAFGSLSSLEDCKKHRKSKSCIVLGKVVKFIDTKTEEKTVKILAREVLPNAKYGMKFKVVIQETLALLVINASLQIGDRLAFFEPHIFDNPSFESQEGIKYILQIGSNKQSVMWYAKKQYILAQPTTPKPAKVQEKETNSSDESSKANNSRDTRQKPQIHLPVNPQIPSDTQKLNPLYVYKNLSQVKSDALLGDFRRVNIFAVVSEVTKGLSKTSTGKYTIICKIVDDSLGPEELINFDLHFFTSEATILSKIEHGDILRLHRVKMERYLNDVDGRIFNSQDIVLFKNDSTDITPISVIKNLSLTDEDKKKISNLKKWFKQGYGRCVNSLLKDITPLSSIVVEGDYNIVCKVVSQPIADSASITFSVSDGSKMMDVAPHISSHIPSKYDIAGISKGHLVTDIEVFERLDDYSKIKINDYVLLRTVNALKTGELRLTISTFSFPMILDLKLDKVLKIESSLKEWEAKIQLGINVDESCKIEENIIDVIQGPQDISKDNSEQVSNNPQVTEKCAINRDSNVNKTMTLRKKSSPIKIPPHESCAKLGMNKVNVVDKTQKCGQAKSAEDKSEGQKTRKQLFTANYMDLSDATDDTSEVSPDQVEEVKPVSQVVVSPANLSIENLIELVKSKYCSPRALPSNEQPPNSSKISIQDKVTTRSKSAKNSQSQLQEPVIKLVRLNDEKVLESGIVQEDNKRKKYVDEKDFELIEDDPEDASTVVNLTLDNVISTSHKNKKMRLDLDSQRQADKCSIERVHGVSTPREIVTHKVTSWLTQHETKNVEDLDLSAICQLLVNKKTQATLDLSSLIASHLRRLQVFLLKVVPDPTEEPLDLVSGYCFEGCQSIFLYSSIVWKEVDNMLTPFCPSCQKTMKDKMLILIFMLQLDIMDRNGNSNSVVVCREHGEIFFGCSVNEFITDLAIRRSRVQLLLDNTVFQHSRSSPFTFPLLDLSMIAINNSLLVVNTKLKLPPNP